MADIGTLLASGVIFLFAQEDQAPIGTAFLIGYPVPGSEEKVVPLVVTAKHVVGDRSKVVARFTGTGSEPVHVLYDLEGLRTSGDFWEHSDLGVDMVVFRTRHFRQTRYSPVPLDLVATEETFRTEDIKTTDRVVFPSLLVNFMGLSRNYPVIRDGTIALIPDDEVPMQYQIASRSITTNQRIILIDATAIPGASGSPVFLWPGPRIKGGAFALGGQKPYLLGILHGFYPAVPREITKIDVTETREFYRENSGIAIVFPSWRLREILEHDSVADHVKQILKAEEKQTD